MPISCEHYILRFLHVATTEPAIGTYKQITHYVFMGRYDDSGVPLHDATSIIVYSPGELEVRYPKWRGRNTEAFETERNRDISRFREEDINKANIGGNSGLGLLGDMIGYRTKFVWKPTFGQLLDGLRNYFSLPTNEV